MSKEDFMLRAIQLSLEGVEAGGGPFGAVVVKDGVIVGEGKNNVTPGQDPTAHAEIVAIRQACAALGTHDLNGCEIYTSCEPCPMCLTAIWWARIGEIYYANDRNDAQRVGFDDELFYAEIALPPERRSAPMHRMLAEQARQAFEIWRDKEDKVSY